MLGLIGKVLFALILVVAGIVFALDKSGAATWGTIALTAPDAAPCVRYAERFPTEPVVTEVRWAWVSEDYGWGCYYEFGDDSKANVPYAKVTGSAR